MSYWDRTLAQVYRLQADILSRARPLAGTVLPAGMLDELRARAAAIDPGFDMALPDEERPVTLGEWLRGIRAVDAGTVASVKPWVQPQGAHDAVGLDEYRSHARVNWRSKIPANTTEPGSDERWWAQEDPALDPVGDEDTGEPVLYTPWEPDLFVTTGQLLSHVGRVWRVVQNHTTAAHWEPGSPGLGALYADEGRHPR